MRNYIFPPLVELRGERCSPVSQTAEVCAVDVCVGIVKKFERLDNVRQ